MWRWRGKMKIQIKHRWTEKVIVEGDYESIKDCLEKNRDAYLGGAYLRNADLRDAYLGGADLRDADLRGAYLRNADLRDAYLGGADLRNTYLRDADLRDAYLRDAYLRDADLRGAYLGDADLRDADLRDAYLRDAYLRDADLRGAKNYSGNHDFAIELIRRQKIETFTEKEWSIIGQISLHRLCWDTIQNRFGKSRALLKIFRVLKNAGFPEYYDRFKKIARG